ncbi:unnamed protein product [Prunus armeniaca]
MELAEEKRDGGSSLSDGYLPFTHGFLLVPTMAPCFDRLGVLTSVERDARLFIRLWAGLICTALGHQLVTSIA